MPEPTVRLPGGFEVPIPKWSRTGFGVIAIVAISFGTYRYFYPLVPELVSVQQANFALRLEVQEYNKHIVETPTITLDDPERVVHVKAFDDGCLIVSRKFAGMATTRLWVDPRLGQLNDRA